MPDEIVDRIIMWKEVKDARLNCDSAMSNISICKTNLDIANDNLVQVQNKIISRMPRTRGFCKSLADALQAVDVALKASEEVVIEVRKAIDELHIANSRV